MIDADAKSDTVAHAAQQQEKGEIRTTHASLHHDEDEVGPVSSRPVPSIVPRESTNWSTDYGINDITVAGLAHQRQVGRGKDAIVGKLGLM